MQLFGNKNGSFLNMSLFPRPDQPQLSETVPTKKLSGFYKQAVHFCEKLIRKGAEYTIIKDLVQSNTIRYISQMIIECHDTHNLTNRDHAYKRPAKQTIYVHP